MVKKYQSHVIALAINILGNRDDALDMAQETFVQVYTNLGRFDTQRNFKTWVLSIAAKRCLDHLRKRKSIFKYFLKQTKGLRIRKIDPTAARNDQPATQKKYTGEPMDFDFKNAYLSAILKLFSKITQCEIMVDPGIEGLISCKMKQVPWDEALDLMLKVNNLYMTRDGNQVIAAADGAVFQNGAAPQPYLHGSGSSFLRAVSQILVFFARFFEVLVKKPPGRLRCCF
ncbi:MAG: type pilus assembly protein PilQ [Acidobacteriota bacterium]|nr:type pilus assembly protein PilQ [Acidobacteriota bacterium]